MKFSIQYGSDYDLFVMSSDDLVMDNSTDTIVVRSETETIEYGEDTIVVQ